MAGAFLLVAAPIVRAGDYFFVLIGLEFIALAILVAFAVRAFVAPPPARLHFRRDFVAIALVASPAVIALFQLTPIPGAWWDRLPGHAVYAQALQAAGIVPPAWQSVSVSPDATRASLLAGLPLAAAFLLGYACSLKQMRNLFRVVAAVAMCEVLLGLLQVSGGDDSPFYFGMQTFGSPIGSLGTRNEYANLLAMSLAVYAWLAYDSLRDAGRSGPAPERGVGRFDIRHAMAAWVAGGLVLAVGLLVSRSRAGLMVGLLAGSLAVIAAGMNASREARGWRVALAATLVAIAAAVALVGLDPIASRVSMGQLAESAEFRGELARSSWDAAMAFFPLGSGWGTYDVAYRPFQTPPIIGYPNHAHMDYVELLVEGGLLFLFFAACFAVAAVRRCLWLARHAAGGAALDRESMLAVVSGIALAGFLLHAAVDFPMRVPANAILASLLAGAFIRPLNGRGGAMMAA